MTQTAPNPTANMHSVPTYTAQIFCGRKVGYTGNIIEMGKIENLVAKFVQANKLGVTVTQTEFYYPGGQKHRGGREPGIIVGLSAYPRYTQDPEIIKSLAIKLAEQMKSVLQQERVCIVCTDTTIMLGEM